MGKTLALGVGSVAIKLWTATEYLVCHPVNALSAIRGNLGELVRAMDVTTPPELVPGAARRHDHDPDSSVLFADLGTDIETNEHFRRVIGKTPRRKTVPQVASWAVLGVFFAIAWLYRLNIKGAVVAYFPLLLMPDRPDVRAAPPATGARTWLAVQTGIFTVCAAALATLYHAPAVREAARALADAAWYTGLVEGAIPHAMSLPRAALWLLGGQAVLYLAARGCHAMARRSEEWSGEAGATPAWRRLAEGGYALHKFAVVVWTALAFATFAPQLGLGLWRLVM